MAIPNADRPVRLGIVGASVRAAAWSAARAGFQVVAADLFADQDCNPGGSVTQIADYPQGFLPWLKSTQVDAWMYTGALENYPHLVDAMACVAPLWGNAGEPLRRSRDAATLRTVLARHGLRMPRLLPAGERPTLNRAWLAKTRRGSSGSGVWGIDSLAAWQQAQAAGAELEERLVSGTSASAIYHIAGEQACLLGVTQQLVGEAIARAKPFQYCGSRYPLAIAPEVAAQLERLGQALAMDLQLQGMVGVDLWIDQHECWVLEINPRYTSAVEVLECATGQIALTPDGQGATTSPLASSKTVTCDKLILFAKQSARLTASFTDWAISQKDLADIPHAGGVLSTFQPVISVLSVREAQKYTHPLHVRVAELESRIYPSN